MPPPNVAATPDATSIRAGDALPVPPLVPVAPSQADQLLPPAAEPPELADLQLNKAWPVVDEITLMVPPPLDATIPSVALLEPAAQPSGGTPLREAAAGTTAQAAAPAPAAEPALAAPDGPQVKWRTAERSP